MQIPAVPRQAPRQAGAGGTTEVVQTELTLKVGFLKFSYALHNRRPGGGRYFPIWS